MLSLFSYLASEKGEKSAALHGQTAAAAIGGGGSAEQFSYLRVIKIK